MVNVAPNVEIVQFTSTISVSSGCLQSFLFFFISRLARSGPFSLFTGNNSDTNLSIWHFHHSSLDQFEQEGF